MSPTCFQSLGDICTNELLETCIELSLQVFGQLVVDFSCSIQFTYLSRWKSFIQGRPCTSAPEGTSFPAAEPFTWELLDRSKPSCGIGEAQSNLSTELYSSRISASWISDGSGLGTRILSSGKPLEDEGLQNLVVLYLCFHLRACSSRAAADDEMSGFN